MKRFCLYLCLMSLLGSGCVDVRVVTSDETHVPVVGESLFKADEFLSVGRQTTAASNHEYLLLSLLKGSVRLRLDRPALTDANVMLSVPGTYTSPAGKPEGYVVLNGTIVQSRERQGWNGAAFFRTDGTLSIFETNNGKVLTKDYLKTVERDGGSLVQGHLLVHDGISQKLLPQTPYQRRALVVFREGRVAIIESVDLLDLSSFAEDLIELGAVDAMNLDMGQWSEGWYTDPATGKRVTIGYLNGATEKQSNWITFEK